MQSGGECLRAFVSIGLDQISQWHDAQGGSFVLAQVYRYWVFVNVPVIIMNNGNCTFMIVLC